MEKQVQIIGDYLEKVKLYLEEYGIGSSSVTGHIKDCSPLAMSGEGNSDDIYRYIFSKSTDRGVFSFNSLINLQKNLSEILSRDPRLYSQGVCANRNGKWDREYNDAEYIVIMNTGMALTVYVKDVLYSAVNNNNHMTDIQEDPLYNKYEFPFHPSFNWKYYYDSFIASVLSSFDSERIILIRTNSSNWYMKGRTPTPCNKRAASFRRMIEDIDEYFIEKTGCIVLNDHYNHIPSRGNTQAFPYAVLSDFSSKRIAAAINDIISGGTEVKNSKETTTKEHLQRTETLSDYVISEIINNKRSPDAERINRYIANGLIDINDFIGLYYIYSKYDNNDLINVIDSALITQKVTESDSFYPAVSARKLFKTNIDFLLKKGLGDREILRKTEELKAENTDKGYIPLDNGAYILIDLSSKKKLELKVFELNSTVPNEALTAKNLSCSIKDLFAISASPELYVKRRIEETGDKPVEVLFEDVNEFADSLWYIDYSSLANNCKYFLRLKNNEALKTGAAKEVAKSYKPEVYSNRIIHHRIDEYYHDFRYMDELCKLYEEISNGEGSDEIPFNVKEKIENDRNIKNKINYWMRNQMIMKGFILADKLLEKDGSNYHFIKRSRHLGDVSRGISLISLFKSYHNFAKDLPPGKLVALVPQNRVELMKLNPDIDDFIVCTPDELLCLQAYALSDRCIHRLYAESERMLEAWNGVIPTQLEIYGIPEDYYFNNRELFRECDSMSIEALFKVSEMLDRKGISAEKTVVIAPRALSSSELPYSSYIKCIQWFKKIGYSVFTNIGIDEEVIDGTEALSLPAEELFALAQLGALIIGVQSGLMDTIKRMNIVFKNIALHNMASECDIAVYGRGLTVSSNRSKDERILWKKAGADVSFVGENEKACASEMIMDIAGYYVKGNIAKSFTERIFNNTIADNELANLYSDFTNTTDISEYIGICLKDENNIIILSVNSKAGESWKKTSLKELLNIKADLCGSAEGYSSVICQKGVLAEKVGQDKINGSIIETRLQHGQGFLERWKSLSENSEQLQSLPSESRLWVNSIACDKLGYYRSLIVIDGVNYSLNKNGLNIVIYNRKYACVTDSISVDIENDECMTIKREAFLF